MARRNKQPAATTVRRPQTRRHRFLMRAAAVGLSLFAAVVLAEMGLLLAGYEPLQLNSKVLLMQSPQLAFQCYSSNPNGEFQRLPNTSRGDWTLLSNALPPKPLPLTALKETPWCVEYARSRQGLRNEELLTHAPAGVTRIVCVGDSFVFGEGVPLSGTLPRRLQAELGQLYEVINFGGSGLNTHQELKSLLSFRSAVSCSRVLLVFIANDIQFGPELARRQQYINDLINIRDEGLRQNQSPLKTVDLIRSPLAMRRITRDTLQWYLDLYDPAKNAEGLDALRRDFRSFAQLDDCQVVLVLYPLMEGLEGPYFLAPVYERVEKMGREAGLPVCNLLPAFAGHNTQALQVHPSDHHPNTKANTIAATAILKWLRENNPGFLQPDKAR